MEKELATHSSILASRIPWTEEPGGLQPMGSQRVRHDRATNTNRIPWWRRAGNKETVGTRECLNGREPRLVHSAASSRTRQALGSLDSRGSLGHLLPAHCGAGPPPSGTDKSGPGLGGSMCLVPCGRWGAAWLSRIGGEGCLPHERGARLPSPPDGACTFGDNALTGEPEALGLNHQGAGPGSALSASLGGDGLVRLWPSGILDLTPGHRGLLPPSLKRVGRRVPPAWGQEHLALCSGASCPGTGTQHSEGAAPGAQRLTSQGEKLGSTRGKGASRGHQAASSTKAMKEDRPHSPSGDKDLQGGGPTSPRNRFTGAENKLMVTQGGGGGAN